MEITYQTDTQKPKASKEVGIRVKYYVGWECTLNGKKYKHVLGLV
jgi:hypothetical protein